jgi:anti-sigma factor (TIGR02949 family)
MGGDLTGGERMTSIDPCDWCEEVLQPFLDRELTDAEMREAEVHLDGCSYCRTRYKFEQSLRRYVRQVVEPMPAEMKARLSQLRLEL